MALRPSALAGPDPRHGLPCSLSAGAARPAPGSPLVGGELPDRDISPQTSAEGTGIVGISVSEVFRMHLPRPYAWDTTCLSSRYQLPFTLRCSLFSFLDVLDLYHIDDSPKYGIVCTIQV